MIERMQLHHQEMNLGQVKNAFSTYIIQRLRNIYNIKGKLDSFSVYSRVANRIADYYAFTLFQLVLNNQIEGITAKRIQDKGEIRIEIIRFPNSKNFLSDVLIQMIMNSDVYQLVSWGRSNGIVLDDSLAPYLVKLQEYIKKVGKKSEILIDRNAFAPPVYKREGYKEREGKQEIWKETNEMRSSETKSITDLDTSEILSRLAEDREDNERNFRRRRSDNEDEE